MPRLEVRVFAILKERLETETVQVVYEEPLTAGGLLALADVQFPAARGLFRHCRVAVNREFRPADAVIQPGDDVALIPPIAGG